MLKKIIVILAVILNMIYLAFQIYKEISNLEKEYPVGRSCARLKNEVCSAYLWGRVVFQKNSHCKWKKCPGFTYYENGKLQKYLSFITIIEIIINQFPAWATLVLLLLKISE